MVRMTTSLQET